MISTKPKRKQSSTALLGFEDNLNEERMAPSISSVLSGVNPLDSMLSKRSFPEPTYKQASLPSMLGFTVAKKKPE